MVVSLRCDLLLEKKKSLIGEKNKINCIPQSLERLKNIVF